MQTKTDADIAMKLVTGSKIAPRRRKTKRKETLKTPLQVSAKALKISMEQELQICSIESQKYMWKSDEEEQILESEEHTEKPQDQEEYLN